MANDEDLIVCEVLFGTAINEKQATAYNYCKNLIILLGKCYINSQRSFNKPLQMQSYLNLIKSKLNVYKRLIESLGMKERVDVKIKDGINLIMRYLRED